VPPVPETSTERPPPGEVDTLLTVPNLFTLVRLLCLPVFLWLLLGRHDRAPAAFLLAGLGATDWVDGYLARRLGQVSEFGKKFDPTVDRLVFIVSLLAIIADGAAPRWFCILVLARELLVGGAVAIATVAFSMERFDVLYVGKVATFLLLMAVPMFVVGSSDLGGHEVFTVLAWVVGIPGLVLSWYTAARYVPRIRHAVARGRAAAGR
jgi:cardiolipin synthase (CMP-forming)